MKNKKGATLVGSIVAVNILVITFITLLNLQASIIRAKFFLQNDNIANLLVAEGLEITRAIYEAKSSITSGTYQVDYETVNLNSSNISNCDSNTLNTSCDMDIPSNNNGYKISNTNTNKNFYRFINVIVSEDITSVTSTVVVKNPRGSNKVYMATTKFYKIN
jgi:hypothetical protein